MGTQKINNSKLETYGIVISFFLVDDKDKKSQFFKESFILTAISMDTSFGMIFLTLSNIEVNFNNVSLSRGHTSLEKPYLPQKRLS